MLMSHSDRSRAYWRVVMHCPGPPTRKQELAQLLAHNLDVIVDRLAGWLCQLKPDRASGLLLAHACAIDGVAVGGNVIHFYGDDIAAPELAIDCEIEERKVAR